MFLAVLLIPLCFNEILGQDVTTISPYPLTKDCFNYDCPSNTFLCKRRTSISPDKQFIQIRVCCLDKRGKELLRVVNKTANVLGMNLAFASYSICLAKDKNATATTLAPETTTLTGNAGTNTTTGSNATIGSNATTGSNTTTGTNSSTGITGSTGTAGSTGAVNSTTPASSSNDTQTTASSTTSAENSTLANGNTNTTETTTVDNGTTSNSTQTTSSSVDTSTSSTTPPNAAAS